MNKRIALWLVVLLALTSLSLSASADISHERNTQLIAEVNAERARRGLSTLREDPSLMQAAALRAQEITELFSHTRPDGSSCFTVSEMAYGENIARGHNSVNRVMAAWMTSSGHRQNILRASYGCIGVCCLYHNGLWYWVQLFGK